MVRLNLAHPSEVLPEELTARAIFMGLAIGCLLCFTNLYFGLQTGWISMMSLQSALMGYLLARMIPSVSPFTPQENVILQTTAVATGTMPLAAGFVGIIPALGLLDAKKDGQGPMVLSWPSTIAWSCAIAFFGVFLAAPLRKQVIIKEQLVFPSGTATAQLIAVLHGEQPIDAQKSHMQGQDNEYVAVPTDEAETISHPQTIEDISDSPDGRIEHSWQTLGWSFTLSGCLTLLAYFFPIVFSIPLFGRYLAREWLWSFSPSLSYVGQGIIMGFPTTLSMNMGMIVGWAVLSPIAKHAGWAPGPVSSMSDGARGWILWVALAIMCAESAVSLLPVIAELARMIKLSLANANHDSSSHTSADEETESPERLVPTSWTIAGITASVLGGTVLVWVVFGSEGIKPWATIVSFAIGSVLALLGVRALGETDLNPVSGLGKVAQLAFALLQPGNVIANIIAGGVAEAGAQQAGDLMQDLKTGHILHASPRAQFFGQLIGSALSIVVSATAYSLYVRAYSIPSANFPAPTAYVWLNLARLLRNNSLPPMSGRFMLCFGLGAAIVAAIKVSAVRRGFPWAKWIPSGVAFAIGFLNAPSFSIARLIGGVISEIWYRRVRHQGGGKSSNSILIIIMASGFVLGEGVVSIIGLLLKTAGIGVISCWGCSGGICPTCPA
ncbi:hypothetical protein FRC03_002744 [Tulasnella sp. 419]|nr:hypothetical protein FRC03_002744 [Tulasnella sp. 419]